MAEKRSRAKPVDYENLHRRVHLACARVRAERAGGSGTIIWSGPQASTYVLTNFHVVEGLIKVEDYWDPVLQREAKRDVRGLPAVELFAYRWESRATGATSVEAEIVAYDRDEDLALLHLRSSQAPPAVASLYPRGEEGKLRIGMPVFCVGAGLGEPPVTTYGILSQFGREIEHKEYWLSTAPSIYGNSGGALFLADTLEMLGVPARLAVMGGFLGGSDAITHLSFAIPVTRIYDFLEQQCFRFVYDSTFTEDGEAKERRRRKDADRMQLSQKERAEGAAP